MNYYMDMQYILRYIIKVGTSKSSIPKYVQCLLSIYIYISLYTIYIYILVILIGCVVATSEYGRVRLRPHRSRDGELGMENQL